MNLKIVLLSTLLIANGFAVNAQKYTEATIVQQNGDSINGFVKLPGSNKSPFSFKFSPGGTDNFSEYSSSAVKAIVVKNTAGELIYESHAIRFESSSQTIGSLATKGSPVWKEGVFFIQVLAKGSINLYKFTDNYDRDHFFIAKAGEAPEELLMKKYMAGDMLATNDSYRSQLEIALKDCSRIKKGKIALLNYDEKKILNLITDYNSCNSSVAYTANTEKPKFIFYVMGGASFSSVSGNGASLLIKKFSNSIFPSVGAGLNIIFPGNQKKSSVVIELLVRKQKHTGNANQYVSPTNYSEFMEKYNFTYLRLNTMYRRFFTNRINKPYYQAGLALAYAVQFKNDGELKTVDGTSTSVTRYQFAPMDKRFEGGLQVGMGYPLSAHSAVEARFELSTGVESLTGSSGGVKSLYVFYSYRF